MKPSVFVLPGGCTAEWSDAESGAPVDVMTPPVLVNLLPGPPTSARRAAPPVAAHSVSAVLDLDDIVESAECSCDAGDDNPH